MLQWIKDSDEQFTGKYRHLRLFEKPIIGSKRTPLFERVKDGKGFKINPYLFAKKTESEKEQNYLSVSKSTLIPVNELRTSRINQYYDYLLSLQKESKHINNANGNFKKINSRRNRNSPNY